MKTDSSTADPEGLRTGKASYQPCGDKLELCLELQFTADGMATISSARFTAKGCAPVVAVADLGCSMLQGLSLEQARCLSMLDIDKAIGPLPPSKRHAYLLFLECLSGALDQHNQIQKEKS
jgi:NifU-like protein involved in Fe-S cluster formation